MADRRRICPNSLFGAQSYFTADDLIGGAVKPLKNAGARIKPGKKARILEALKTPRTLGELAMKLGVDNTLLHAELVHLRDAGLLTVEQHPNRILWKTVEGSKQ